MRMRVVLGSAAGLAAAVAAIALFVPGVAGAQPPEEIAWLTDLNEARARAEEQDRPIMLEFFSPT